MRINISIYMYIYWYIHTQPPTHTPTHPSIHIHIHTHSLSLAHIYTLCDRQVDARFHLCKVTISIFVNFFFQFSFHKNPVSLNKDPLAGFVFFFFFCLPLPLFSLAKEQCASIPSQVLCAGLWDYTHRPYTHRHTHIYLYIFMYICVSIHVYVYVCLYIRYFV